MNIILTALIAAAMGALAEFLPRPVRMALFTVAAFWAWVQAFQVTP
jgi:hypothetical protein